MSQLEDTHRFADGWMNAAAYVRDEHPNPMHYEEHLMGCPVCQEFVDLAFMVVLKTAPVIQPSLLAWYVLAVLWNEESATELKNRRSG